MHRAAHSSSQVLGGERYRLITPQCETLWCSLCGRSVGRSDSCALREPPSLAWLDKLATTWNTVWSHIKPCLRAASDNPARFAGVRVLGVDERCVASPGPTSTGPRELIGIVDHSREGSPHGAGPLPGTERTPSTINSKTPPASSMPSISSSSLATFQVRCVARVQQDTTSHCGRKGDPLYQIRLLLRASRHRLTPRQKERLREAFTADEAHISVDVAYLHRASARGLPPSHTRPRPTPGRIPNPAPTTCPIPEIARLGRTLRKWKDALNAYFDTDGASNGSTEAINGHYRAGQTNRQRLPQPHQLPTPNAHHRRRFRCLHPHSTLKSP